MVLSLERWVDKVAVITGASSGIGANLAERLVKEGIKVVGLARRKERLQALADKLSSSRGSFLPISTDLTKEEDILKAFKWVNNNLGPVHILINNAGISTGVQIINGNTQDWKNTLDTNVLALSIATREAINSMKDNHVDGHIVNISSVAGHYVLNYPIPISIYTASKHAVRALGEAIRIELVNGESKIKITNVSPGLVATELVPDKLLKAKDTKILQPDDITDGIIYALSTPPHVQVHELMIRPVGEP